MHAYWTAFVTDTQTVGYLLSHTEKVEKWAKLSKSQYSPPRLIVTLSYSKFEQKCVGETEQPRYFSGAKSTLNISHHITPAAHWSITRIKILGNLKLYNINIELSNYSNIHSQFANISF